MSTTHFIILAFMSTRMTSYSYVLNKEAAENVQAKQGINLFPGTLWCGKGNIAENSNDLGMFAEADKCCREHDNCNDYILSYSTKYNLTNLSSWTRLPCECDENLRKCFLNAKTITSYSVGIIYFDLLGQQCFKKEYPIIGCKTKIYFPNERCLEYILDTSKEKKYQWFDDPLFFLSVKV